MAADKTKVSTTTSSNVKVLVTTTAPKVIVLNTLNTSIGAGSGGGYENETILNQSVI